MGDDTLVRIAEIGEELGYKEELIECAIAVYGAYTVNRTIDAKAAAALVIACEEDGKSAFFRDIAEEADAPVGSITGLYQSTCNELEIRFGADPTIEGDNRG